MPDNSAYREPLSDGQRTANQVRWFEPSARSWLIGQPPSPQTEDIVSPTSTSQLFKSIVVNNDDGVIITEAAPFESPGPRIVYVNAAFTRITGYTSAEVLGATPRLLQGPETSVEQLGHIRAALAHRQPVRAELVNYRKDGTPFRVALTIFPIHDANGLLTHWAAVQREITVRKQREDVLHRDLQFVKGILDATPDIIFIYDLRAERNIYVNRHITTMLGYTAANLEAMGSDLLATIMHPDDFAATPRYVPQLLALPDGARLTRDYRLRAADGSWRWFATREIIFQRNADGTPAEVLGTLRDITERIQGEQRLATHDAITQALAAARSLDGVMPRLLQIVCQTLEWELGAFWEIDPHVHTLRCRAVYHPPDAQLAGFAAASSSITFVPGVGLPGRVWSQRQPAWIENLIEDQNFPRIQAAQEAGLGGAFAFPILIDDVVLGVIEFFSREPRLPDTALINIAAAIGSEVGQFIRRRSAEEALRAAEAKYRTLVEHIPAISYIAAPDSTGLLYVSPQAETLLGYPPEAWKADPTLWATLLHPDDRERVVAENERARALGLPFQADHRVVARDGRVRWFRNASTAVYDDSGNVQFFHGVAVDVTEQKEAEAQRAELERTMLMTQKLESLGMLAGGIAHDFNNLLTVILGNTSLALTTDGLPDDVKRTMEQVELAGRQAAALTQQLLDYTGKGQFYVQPCDLNALSAELAPLLRTAVGDAVTLQCQLAADLPLVAADVVQLRQAVMNLVINGAEAMGGVPGTVTISTRVENIDVDALRVAMRAHTFTSGHYVLLTVQDTGGGMDAATRARIFDPFFTTKFTGRGLGLAVVHGIVERHNGAIQVESAVGEGTCVTILLPAILPPAGSQPPQTKSATGAQLAGTVLVVDDDGGVRAIVARVLRGMGLRVLEASDGLEGVAVFEAYQEDIHCVLLDLTMPKMSGAQAARAMLRLRPNVPIVLISGYSEQDVFKEIGEQAVAGFLQKPFSPRDLRQTVQRILMPELSPSTE